MFGLLLVVIFVLTATILLEIYTLRQFEKVTTIAIEHEGNLLSDLLEASITPYLATRDIEGMQANLDRIAATREKNDIEMNIMLLEGDGSATVASNVPSNIEGTDPEEHEELLKSLAFNQPVVFIESPETGEDPDEEFIDESHPDFYISSKKRIISITTPLTINERK
jgi:YbbR domain-containing protein